MRVVHRSLANAELFFFFNEGDLDVDTTTFPWKRLTKGSNAESVAFPTGSVIDEAVST